MERGHFGLGKFVLTGMLLGLTIGMASSLTANQALMLNPDLLQMLMNGGFDMRQPARIFLPPKYYTSRLHDSGHRSPEDIFRSNLELMMEAVYDNSLLNQSPSTASLSQAALPTATASGETFNRLNSISYSDDGTGNHNKGSGVLKKNAVANFKSSLPSLSSAASGRTMAVQTRDGVSQIVSPLGGSNGANSRQSFDRSDPRRDATGSYNLRSALPGEPDVDYPILGRIPETSFKCHQRRDGYYADVEARCQVFRVCANTDDSGSGFAFLCPNGTLFNQKYFVCDWYMNVRCEESVDYYGKNEELGKTTSEFSEMMGAVMSMVSFPMISSVMSDGAIDTFRPISSKNDILEGGLNTAKLNGVKSGIIQVHQHTNKNLPHPYPQVYVSSLGTLSTDPESGFDPAKSTFLVPPSGVQLPPPRLSSGWRASSMDHLKEETISTPPMPKVEFQLLMGKLLKSWTDMGYAKAPTEQFQPTRVILPPSGVLPPSPVSLGTNRVWTIMGKSQIAKAPAAPRNPNPSTVQNVIRVNKVSVVPQSFRPLGFGYVRNIGNVIPQSVPRITVVNLPSLNPSSGQISRRNGILVQRILPQTPVDVGREVGYDIEFIPSNGYYLNNEEERKSYFHTLRKRLLGLEKSSNFNAGVSSYNVPKSSRGSFFDARY